MLIFYFFSIYVIGYIMTFIVVYLLITFNKMEIFNQFSSRKDTASMCGIRWPLWLLILIFSPVILFCGLTEKIFPD